jgi:hypothetical protein
MALWEGDLTSGQTVHFPAKPQDHQSVQLLLDTISHMAPIGAVHLIVVLFNFFKPGQIVPVGLPGVYRTFAMFPILQIYPHHKAKNDQDQKYL